MYKRKLTKSSWVMILKVKPTNGPEKIVHISHCCRLFKLATFIFYIYKETLDNFDCQFYYFDTKSKSYGGYFSFKLTHGDIPLPAGVGNMRNARIDSAFFNASQQIGLRIGDTTQEYVIECLETVPPKKGRRYPFVETLKQTRQ